MTVDAQLRVDGVWLAATGLPYSDLQWTDRSDGGNFEATWSMIFPYGARPAPFYKGAKVEIYLGPVRRWYGEMAELGWDDGSFKAIGISQRAKDFPAIASSGQTSSVPDTIIDTAITLGWNVTRPTSFGTPPLFPGDVTDDLNFVGPILDDYAEYYGARWGVWGDGAVQAYYAPTLHDYLLAPGVIELGETTEDTFTAVTVRFLNSATGVLGTTGAGVSTPGVRFHVENIASYGPMTVTTAAAIAQRLLDLGRSAPGWTTQVDASSAQLLTPGGLPVDVASVTAGRVVRVPMPGDMGQTYRDLLIGETKHAAGTDVVSLSPVGQVAANFADVMADVYTRLTGQPVSA